MQSYNTDIAAQMMTLAAIAYGGDSDPTNPTEIQKAIDALLPNMNFATQNRWKRVWGPIVTAKTDNLCFVVQNGSEYAIVLRGTVMTWDSWKEDIPSSQSAYPWYGGLQVSTGFLQGIDEMMTTPYNGQKLVEFFNTVNPSKIYVTGHSQGGGLTPMMMGMVHVVFNLPVEGHAFAPPTAGDPAFANWIDSLGCCYLYSNPLDLVPLGYANMADVYNKGIPITVPSGLEGDAVRDAVNEAIKEANKAGSWQQPKSNTPPLTAHPYHPNKSIWIEEFASAVEGQHNHNSYLLLLGAYQPVDGNASPLS